MQSKRERERERERERDNEIMTQKCTEWKSITTTVITNRRRGECRGRGLKGKSFEFSQSK